MGQNVVEKAHSVFCWELYSTVKINKCVGKNKMRAFSSVLTTQQSTRKTSVTSKAKGFFTRKQAFLPWTPA